LKADEQEKKMTYITSVEKIGIRKGKQEIVLVMLTKGLSVEEIASLTGMTIEQVQTIHSQQK
jgi:predicted transposase YdaD